MTMEIPVQFFQSVIAIELAITGALLFQIHFFEPQEPAGSRRGDLPGPWSRLFMAVVLGATVFGSLYAISAGGQRTAAIAVTVGLAISLLPILLRVLPRLTSSRDDAAVTVLGLVAYVVIVATTVVLLNG
jgi:hypothetical protein